MLQLCASGSYMYAEPRLRNKTSRQSSGSGSWQNSASKQQSGLRSRSRLKVELGVQCDRLVGSGGGWWRGRVEVKVWAYMIQYMYLCQLALPRAS